jgi:hypothetical protein
MSAFIDSWETASYSLHKITHILNGALCVSSHVAPINETIDTLVRLALEEVEEAQQELEALRQYYYTTEMV